VHERVAEARYLLPSHALLEWSTLAGGGPGPDHGVILRGDAADREFERQRSDVLVCKDVAGRIRRRGRGVARAERVEMDQIENRAEIDDEALAALTDEQSPRRVAAGNGDLVDMLIRVRLVVRDRLRSDVVHRLGERGRTGEPIGD